MTIEAVAACKQAAAILPYHGFTTHLEPPPITHITTKFFFKCVISSSGSSGGMRATAILTSSNVRGLKWEWASIAMAKTSQSRSQCFHWGSAHTVQSRVGSHRTGHKSITILLLRISLRFYHQFPHKIDQKKALLILCRTSLIFKHLAYSFRHAFHQLLKEF